MVPHIPTSVLPQTSRASRCSALSCSSESRSVGRYHSILSPLKCFTSLSKPASCKIRIDDTDMAPRSGYQIILLRTPNFTVKYHCQISHCIALKNPQRVQHQVMVYFYKNLRNTVKLLLGYKIQPAMNTSMLSMHQYAPTRILLRIFVNVHNHKKYDHKR